MNTWAQPSVWRTVRAQNTFTAELKDFPGGASGKEPACQCRRLRFNPWVRKIPWRRAREPTPALLPGDFHGQRSLADYSPWGHKESYRIKSQTRLSAHTHTHTRKHVGILFVTL